MENMKKKDLIREALLIRKFEEKLLQLFSEGKLFGTIHTCIGEEWIAVAAANSIQKGDTFFSNHRGHGHFIAKTGNILGLLSEIMGKSTGVCKGIGGSQHLYSPGFFSNGIQGGMVPICTGYAFAEKLNKSKNICVVFIGDGTLGQGIIYESLNIASKWEVPLLIIVENNKISQSTLQEETFAGSVRNRANAFNIKYHKSNTWEWENLLDDFENAVKFVRDNSMPYVLDIDTFRIKAHSKGDDTRELSMISEYEKKDPLNKLLLEQSIIKESILKEVDSEIKLAIDEAEKAKEASTIDNLYEDNNLNTNITWQEKKYKKDRIVKIINKSLKNNFENNSKIIMIGEDIKSPYGGAFKVSKNLSFHYPERILNAPISEQSIIGIGTGLALNGYIPIVEIMFGDFMSLCFDQLINHACKFQYMYNDQVKVPLVIRTPMGGYRGYGPTHSQSLEKYFLGMPNLKILALNIRVSPEEMFNTLFKNISSPTLIIENKVLYTKFLHIDSITGFNILFSNELYSTVKISPSDKDPDVTIFCYGGMLGVVEEVIEEIFFEEEIICEVICPTQIQPLNISPLSESVKKTHKLLTVEEGSNIAALGSEAITKLLENNVKIEKIKRIGCNSFIPTSRRLEDDVLPNKNKIISTLKEIASA